MEKKPTKKELRLENDTLRRLCVDLQWMAKRYAEGRRSYAVSMVNQATRTLLALGIELNPCGEQTVWARDGGGFAYSGLSQEEWDTGEPPDEWYKIIYNEEYLKLIEENRLLTIKLENAEQDLERLR